MRHGIKYTQAFVVFGVLVVAVYDIFALSVWGVEATISRVIGVDASFDSPIIPFAIGVVCGHLFWPQPRKKLPKARAVKE